MKKTITVENVKIGFSEAENRYYRNVGNKRFWLGPNGILARIIAVEICRVWQVLKKEWEKIEEQLRFEINFWEDIRAPLKITS